MSQPIFVVKNLAESADMDGQPQIPDMGAGNLAFSWHGFGLVGQLLDSVRIGHPNELAESALATLPAHELTGCLADDNLRKTFWINAYNTWFQLLHRRNPNAGSQIFSLKQILIGGHMLSLDDIEHGLLRKWRWKYSLGYLPSLRRRSLQGLEVDRLDCRIHFALNCGVAGCPPIRMYTPQAVQAQLELATRSFLHLETTVNRQQKRVLVSRLLLWYLADFGGISGIRKLLAKYMPDLPVKYSIGFKPYDHTPAIGNFSV